VKISVSAAISDPHLLGAAFKGDSWNTWRAILRAAEALPLSPEQRELFMAVADREPPSRPVRELWVVAGRRSGKDSVASGIATTLALGDYREHLRPGERASILCLAVDRQQAKIVNRYIKGYFNNNPLLKSYISKETDDGIELTNNVEIVVATNSFRAVRGRTVVCAILDEIAFFRSDESANPDVEVFNALLPSMVTIPNAMLLELAAHTGAAVCYSISGVRIMAKTTMSW
jgi:phage terminase large subunit-like protein